MEFENLKVGDLIKQTRFSDWGSEWAVWKLIKNTADTSDNFSCKLVSSAGTGWAELFRMTRGTYTGATPALEYIGTENDFPELLL